MTQVDMQKIIAYVDGELPADEHKAVEDAAAKDAGLRAQIDAHRALSARLAGAFAPIADEPMPDALSALLAAPPPSESKPQGNVIAFRPRDLKRFLPQTSAQWGAMAASLIVGVCLALTLGRGPAGDIISKNGELIAQGQLDKALTTQLAADDVAKDAPRTGLTFRDTSGYVCRTFNTHAAEGLACRENNRWRIDLLSRPEVGTTFVQAGSPLIMQAVSSRIDGDAFDAQMEQAARKDGWKAKAVKP